MPLIFECKQCGELARPATEPAEETPPCSECGGTLNPLAVFSPEEELPDSEAADIPKDSADRNESEPPQDSAVNDRPKSRRRGYIVALVVTLIAFGAMFGCLRYFEVLKPSARSQHIAAKEETLQLFNEIATTLEAFGRIRPGEGEMDAMHDAFDRIDICCDRLAEIHNARGDLPDVPEEFRKELIAQYRPKLQRTSKRLDGAQQSFQHSRYTQQRRDIISRLYWLRQNMHYNWRETQ